MSIRVWDRKSGVWWRGRTQLKGEWVHYSDYKCPGCEVTASVITTYTQTAENEYAWRKRVGVIHNDDCPHLLNLTLLFPRLILRIREERSYGKAVA